MPSIDNPTPSEAIVLKTTWILLAVSISAVEFFIPRIPFIPWLKPGLANCVTIIWIVEFGVADALLFTLLRIWIVGFYFGFSFYTITLSFSGGMCSTLAMGLMWMTLGKRGLSGAVGIGIVGALVHNLTQITIVYFLFAENGRIFGQVPLMLAAAIAFGSLTGAIAPSLLNFLRDARAKSPRLDLAAALPRNRVAGRDIAALSLLFSGSCAVAIVADTAALAACAIVATALALFLNRSRPMTVFSPVTRFWPLFLFIACVHCFLSYGTRIGFVPLVTREGIHLTVVQWIRLWTWLEVSLALGYFNFDRVVLMVLRTAFKRHPGTLFAGILALEYFPATVASVRKKRKNRLGTMLRHPVVGMRTGFERLYGEIVDLLSARPSSVKRT